MTTEKKKNEYLMKEEYNQLKRMKEGYNNNSSMF